MSQVNQENHEKWLELADIYAAGALDGNELSEFEDHLGSGCETCQLRLWKNEQALGTMASSYALVSPPDFLKSKVMDQIAEPAVAVAAPRPGMSWALAGIGACAFASILVIVTWNLSRTRKEMHEYAVLMTNPSAKIMEMKGAAPESKAVGRVVEESAGKRCFFMAMGLAPLPDGKIYELWAIKGDKPVPMGTFKVDREGCAMMNLSSFQGMNEFEKFAVTLEPSGGVLQPTGPMVLV